MNGSMRPKSETQRVGIFLLWISLLGLVFLYSAAGCRNTGAPGVPAMNGPAVRNPYEIEKKRLPPEVRQLFYAVKDSLDYAVVTGDVDGPFTEVPEDPPPQASLADYARVTEEVLERFEEDFAVERYRAGRWDYELVVSRRSRPEEKYKATRGQMFRLMDGRWQSIGPYLHR